MTNSNLRTENHFDYVKITLAATRPGDGVGTAHPAQRPGCR